MYPSLTTVIGAGLVALALSLVLWPIVHFAVTLAHEGGHALTASLMGGRVESLKMFGSGGPGYGATAVGGVGWLGSVFTAFAGYVGPSVFGIGGAMLLSHGRVRAALWATLFLLALALLSSGNLVARVTIVAVGALVAVVLAKASAGQTTFFAYTWIWLLLLGGFGHVLVFVEQGRGLKDTSSDAYHLRRLTLLPSSLWSGVFWLGSLCALVYGAGLLLRLYPAGP
jgi:hypothetical protein